MKVLVLGGSGFLGSHVADELTRQGHDVTVFDLIESPYLSDGQMMVAGDILNFDQVMDAVRGQDIIYNFAGYADLDSASTRAFDTAELNIFGNLNVLEAAKRQGVQRYIYASTIYVYSQKGGFYRCSKQASELYVEEYQRKFDIYYTILRYGTLYGPRADSRNSIYRYLASALFDKHISCPNPESQREFIHVSNAAALSVKILEDEYINRHITLTGHYTMKVSEILEIIKEILNNKVEIEYTSEFNNSQSNHYQYTPYSLNPSRGFKLVSNEFIDIGQGLLECLEEIRTNHEE